MVGDEFVLESPLALGEQEDLKGVWRITSDWNGKIGEQKNTFCQNTFRDNVKMSLRISRSKTVDEHHDAGVFDEFERFPIENSR